MRQLKTLWLFCVLFSSFTLSAENQSYGLHIKAYPYDNSEKTSLTLEDDKGVSLTKETVVLFDIQVRAESIFGSVCRIVTNNHENIDFTFTVGDDDRRFPMLVVNESVHIFPQEVKINEEWVTVSITLSQANNMVTMNYDGSIVTGQCTNLSKAKTAQIQFGVSSIAGFTTSDIASVNLRDVKIINNNKLTRHWKLDSYSESINYDLVAGVPAKAKNAEWLSDVYSSWGKVYESTLSHNSQIAYNTKDNVFYIYESGADQIIVLDPESQEETIIQTTNRCALLNAPNQLIYCPKRDNLLIYNIDENLMSWFDFNSRSWSNTVETTVEHGYWNNSISLNPQDSTFISFGGYGFYKYNNELLRINPYLGEIKKTILPDIAPRYCSATVIVDNTLYIFGGRGNRSGRQELSPRNYYDLYSVNLQTEQINKLWSIDPDEWPGAPFLPSANLIYNKEADCFYFLTNLYGGTVFKLHADKKGLELVSFPTGAELTSTYLYRNLYLNSRTNRLYGLIYIEKSDKTSTLSIYSLKYPPATISEEYVLAEGNKEGRSQSGDMLISTKSIIAIISVILLMGSIILYYRIRNKRSRAEGSGLEQGLLGNSLDAVDKDSVDVVLEQKAEMFDDGAVKEEALTQDYKPGDFYDFSKQSISFLGIFSVKDKEGKNITSQFTPMLKHLLIILILSSAKNKKGIASRELLQIFWFDKDERAAKNNRNVYLSKLRSIFDNIGDIKIESVNKFWTIEFSDEITCDYLEIAKLTFQEDDMVKDISEEERTNRLLELLLRGTFLPNTEEDWLDTYKSDFSNLTIDILTGLLENKRDELSEKTKTKMADTIFLHDPINEFALHIKCSTLFDSDKKGLAKVMYDNFKKEYEQLLGAEYKKPLEEVINGF